MCKRATTALQTVFRIATNVMSLTERGNAIEKFQYEWEEFYLEI